MTTRLELDSLDSAKYLYLRELSELRDNSLRLVVQEAVVNPSGLVQPHPELPELEEILKGASPIESTGDCRSFELTCRYDDEMFSGKLFRVYTKSHFLEHLARDTGGHTEAILHYKLTCLNHLIDVAAYTAPEVSQVAPVLSTPTLIQ
jgi:hypothetical protein